MKYLVLEVLVRLLRFIPMPDSIVKQIKEHEELKFWKVKKAQEKVLGNAHYEFMFTASFDVDKNFYSGKKVIDIGCGPRGSMEFMDNAAERIGFDPLADEYLKLGGDQHKMTYVKGYSENMPFADNSIDVVTSINSLDHVEDLPKTLSEIGRVLKPGGHFLMAVDIHSHPTPTEPISIPWNLSEQLKPQFEVEYEKHLESAQGITPTVKKNVPYNHQDKSDRYGVLLLRVRKV